MTDLIPRKRKAIPPKLREKIWKNEFGNVLQGICPVCNSTQLTALNFECGHVISVKNKGDDTENNLRPICGSCNKSMSDENWDLYIKRNYYKKSKLNRLFDFFGGAYIVKLFSLIKK